jgi:hypothetical protein
LFGDSLLVFIRGRARSKFGIPGEILRALIIAEHRIVDSKVFHAQSVGVHDETYDKHDLAPDLSHDNIRRESKIVSPLCLLAFLPLLFLQDERNA